MEYELYNLNVVREAEHEGNVHDSTTLLDPSEGKTPTKNKGITVTSIASEAYNASRQNFVHDSEDDLCVHMMSFKVIRLSTFLADPPQNT